MKLYYTPGACSLADHIALHEAGMTFDLERVDLRTKTTESGQDFATVNPKGYVPALVLDGGETVTENIAILSWIADRAPQLGSKGPLGRIRLLEMLAYISTQIHKGFTPFHTGASDAERAKAGEAIARRLALIAEHLDGDYLFGSDVTVADAYLLVMLMWAKEAGIAVAEPLPGYFDRMAARDAVKTALAHEDLA